MPTQRHPSLEVLARPNVRRYIVQRFFSALARSLLHATLAWHLWKATGSYAFLGLLGVVEFAPVIPASLLAGALADTWDRKRIVLISQTVAMVAAGALWAGSSNPAGETSLVLVAAFALALTTSFENPAGSALLPALVPRALFPAATVVISNVRNAAGVSGPVLMAGAVQLAGIPAAYAVTALLFAVGLIALATVTCPPIEDRQTRVSWASIREGIAFVRGHGAILGSITLDMFAVIFAGATAMLPVYADDILGVGEWGYGILSASMQIGTFLMAGILLVTRPIVRPGRAMLISVLFFGLATIVFGLSRWFPLSVLAFVIAGMADQISMVTRSIILQLSTPDALRGRVNSVNMIFIGASNELGAAESGFLAALTSATVSVVAGGVACLAVLGTIWTAVPSLRRYELDGSGVPVDRG